MNETDLPYTTDLNIKNKKDDVYVNARIKIKERLWNIFKGTVSIEGFNIPDALNDAITIWLTKRTKYVKCKCSVCKCVIDLNNYCYHFKDGEFFYYCSLKCLKDDEHNIKK